MDDWSPGAKRPKMSPKVNMYLPDGDGRDYLISMNSNKNNNASSGQNRYKNPRIPEHKHGEGSFNVYCNPISYRSSLPNLRKTFGAVNYTRFGKERDGFINDASGGFKNNNEQLTQKTFFKQFRNYDKDRQANI